MHFPQFSKSTLRLTLILSKKIIIIINPIKWSQKSYVSLVEIVENCD